MTARNSPPAPQIPNTPVRSTAFAGESRLATPAQHHPSPRWHNAMEIPHSFHTAAAAGPSPSSKGPAARPNPELEQQQHHHHHHHRPQLQRPFTPRSRSSTTSSQPGGTPKQQLSKRKHPAGDSTAAAPIFTPSAGDSPLYATFKRKVRTATMSTTSTPGTPVRTPERKDSRPGSVSPSKRTSPDKKRTRNGTQSGSQSPAVLQVGENGFYFSIELTRKEEAPGKEDAKGGSNGKKKEKSAAMKEKDGNSKSSARVATPPTPKLPPPKPAKMVVFQSPQTPPKSAVLAAANGVRGAAPRGVPASQIRRKGKVMRASMGGAEMMALRASTTATESDSTTSRAERNKRQRHSVVPFTMGRDEQGAARAATKTHTRRPTAVDTSLPIHQIIQERRSPRSSINSNGSANANPNLGASGIGSVQGGGSAGIATSPAAISPPTAEMMPVISPAGILQTKRSHRRLQSGIPAPVTPISTIRKAKSGMLGESTGIPTPVSNAAAPQSTRATPRVMLTSASARGSPATPEVLSRSSRAEQDKRRSSSAYPSDIGEMMRRLSKEGIKTSSVDTVDESKAEQPSPPSPSSRDSGSDTETEGKGLAPLRISPLPKPVSTSSYHLAYDANIDEKQ
ncbi:hypothetical protein BS50DRAFT_252129 [Corynespora cassiicola Philippines]|uniref:Uncharacterized protein n=1 Tax=Corynespora cassiicola Philippines TaxID=1448308 RepID=A0A2T2P446_CORCC|nr:hypothetical protein BS50DRAFT_252129 [Corynespora cassiicola Philippines]